VPSNHQYVNANRGELQHQQLMSSYTAPSPSAPPAGGAEASATSSGMIGSVLSHLPEASTFAKARTAEFQQNLHDGSWSLRFLALVGALGMMTVAVLGFLHDVVMFQWVSAIFEVYTFILGIIMIVLEYGRSLSFFSRIEATIYRNALFVKYVWGRGMLYFVAGTLTIALGHLVAIIVGGYVCCVGLLFVIVGRSSARKLANAKRSSVTPEQLQEKFAIADVDGKGALSTEQFGKLITEDLGLDMTRREMESAFLQLDCESRGRVSYESVLRWWNDAGAEDYEMV